MILEKLQQAMIRHDECEQLRHQIHVVRCRHDSSEYDSVYERSFHNRLVNKYNTRKPFYMAKLKHV